MKPYAAALIATLALGAAACGDGNEGDGGASPTAPSAMGGGTSRGGCTRPGAPTGLTSTVSFNNVAFAWSGVGGANDYLVMVGPTPGTSSTLSTNTTQTTYNWNGAQSGRYYARVEARNACGSGPSSNEIAFTIN